MSGINCDEPEVVFAAVGDSVPHEGRAGLVQRPAALGALKAQGIPQHSPARAFPGRSGRGCHASIETSAPMKTHHSFIGWSV